MLLKLALILIEILLPLPPEYRDERNLSPCLTVFETRFHVAQASLKLLMYFNSPASSSSMLGLQAGIATFGLCGAKDQNKGLEHARQALHQLSYSYSRYVSYIPA